MEFRRPEEIEAGNFQHINKKLDDRLFLTGADLATKRIIHTTVDPSFADTLLFSEGMVEQEREAIRQGACIVMGTSMAPTGIGEVRLVGFGITACCPMAGTDVVAEAEERDVTHATVSMERTITLFTERPLIFVIGNASTALVKIKELMDIRQLKPTFLVVVPVGFVSVVEAKEFFVGGSTSHVIARSRKGGSIVTAAIVNVVLYQI